MSALYASEQVKLDEMTADDRIASLSAIDKANGHTFMRSYAGLLIPATCTQNSVDRLEKAVKELTDLTAGTRRSLLVNLQEDQRCVMIKNKMSIH